MSIHFNISKRAVSYRKVDKNTSKISEMRPESTFTSFSLCSNLQFSLRCSCSPLCFSQYGPTLSDLTREATLVTRPPFWSPPRLNNVSVSIRFTSLPQHFKRHLISYLFTALSRDLKFKIACIFNSKLSQGRRRRRRGKKFHVHFATFWQTWPPLAGVEGLCGTKVGPLAVPGLKAIGATD